MSQIKLLRIKDEVSNIKTFVFETGGLTWTPGFYAKFSIDSVDGDEKAKQRYFTLASAPNENEMHISTRVSDSAFKQALNSMRVGDCIEIEGIEGDFTWENDAPVVLVAGGIGVTPYRSILVGRAAQGKMLDAHLLYFSRDDNFAFKNEFDQLVNEHPELEVNYIVGESISADSIMNHAPEAKERVVYVSGPEAMVDSVGEDLTSRGITLKQDWFPGYTDTTY
ncbi:FAD-dependent oxidoreductase [Candidatus Saccharibacteria bacterium]|nr:FAD-dependent oxidoreductase [Candidatus Saccharibacteria bacterium]